MNKLIFYKQISPRYLEFLNWILTNENLDPLSKQDIYEIITTIISYNLETQYESTIEELLELCEDTQVKNNVCFSELLSKIKHLVMKESPTSVSLAAKLLCIIKVAKHMNLKSDFDLIMQLSNSKLSQDNYEFLQVIFSNVIINTNPEIKKIILEEVLSYHMSENTIADFDFHATVFSNLTNSFALSTDAETYRKIVRISLMGESSYYLLQLLNHKGLQESKKKIAIDYYYNLNNLPSLPKNNINSVAELGKIANKNIYSIIFSPELLNMSDQEYRETLDRIPNSKSPLSYANVLASPLLNKDRQIGRAHV